MKKELAQFSLQVEKKFFRALKSKISLLRANSRNMEALVGRSKGLFLEYFLMLASSKNSLALLKLRNAFCHWSAWRIIEIF